MDLTPDKRGIRRPRDFTEASLPEPTLQDREQGRTSQGNKCIHEELEK
jgi:hypothetical protein